MNPKLQNKLYNHPTAVDSEAIWMSINKKKKRRFIPFILAGIFTIVFTTYFVTFTLGENLTTDLAKTETFESIKQSKNNHNAKTLEQRNDTKALEDLKNINSISIVSPELLSTDQPTQTQTEQQTVKLPEAVSLKNKSSKNILIGRNKTKVQNIDVQSITYTKNVIEKRITGSNLLIDHIRASDLRKLETHLSLVVSRSLDQDKNFTTLALVNFINPVETLNGHSIFINIGTTFSPELFSNHTEALPGINASIFYKKYLKDKISLGLGLNYLQFREHLNTVYRYTEPNQIDAPITLIYSQDGSIETINSLVTVFDKYDRSISKVNQKSRVDLSLLVDYRLFTVGRFLTYFNNQLNYNLLADNEGLELLEMNTSLYDINTDELNLINTKNKFIYSFGLTFSYAMTRQFELSISAQRFHALNPYYTDQSIKYKGFNGGVSIEYKW